MAKTKFRPLHDRVVVRRIDAEEKTKGGIIIPDTAKEKPQEGEVITVGPGGRDESGKLIPIDVKPGNRVSGLKKELGLQLRLIRVPARFNKFGEQIELPTERHSQLCRSRPKR